MSTKSKDELTAIYNEANGLDPKRFNPITTERIFAAMMESALRERKDIAAFVEGLGFPGVAAEILSGCRDSKDEVGVEDRRQGVRP